MGESILAHVLDVESKGLCIGPTVRLHEVQIFFVIAASEETGWTGTKDGLAHPGGDGKRMVLQCRYRRNENPAVLRC